jgi:hypothetical protein
VAIAPGWQLGSYDRTARHSQCGYGKLGAFQAAANPKPAVLF